MFDVNKGLCLLNIFSGQFMKTIEIIQPEKPVQSGCRSKKKFHVHSPSSCVCEFVFLSMCVSVCLLVRVLCACVSFSASIHPVQCLWICLYVYVCVLLCVYCTSSLERQGEERAGKYVVHVILPLSKEERGDKEVFVPWALYQEGGEKDQKSRKDSQGGEIVGLYVVFNFPSFNNVLR